MVQLQAQLDSVAGVVCTGILMGAGRPIEIVQRVLAHARDMAADGSCDEQSFATVIQAVVSFAPDLHKLLDGVPDTCHSMSAAALSGAADVEALTAQAVQLLRSCSTLSAELGSMLQPAVVPSLQDLMCKARSGQSSPLDVAYRTGVQQALEPCVAGSSSSSAGALEAAAAVQLADGCIKHVRGLCCLLKQLSLSG